jgi:hypothetical protein
MLGTLSAALGASLVWATLQAQAEPAPPEPGAPPPAAAPELPPPTAMAVHGRFAYRPGDAVGPAPAAGFSLGATFERRYAAVDILALGAGLDLFFDHFASDTTINSTTAQTLTHTSFALLQTAALELGRVRPWVGAGVGATVSYFSGTSPTIPGATVSDTEVQPIVRGAAGVDVTVAPQMAIAVRADFTHPLTRPTFGGYASSPFGADLVDVGAGLRYRF